MIFHEGEIALGPALDRWAGEQGYLFQDEAAAGLGISQPRYSSLLNGTRGVGRKLVRTLFARGVVKRLIVELDEDTGNLRVRVCRPRQRRQRKGAAA